MYWSIIGTFATVIVGIVVSWLTASKEDIYDSKLLFKLALKLSQYLPGKDRQYKDLPIKTTSGLVKDLKVTFPAEKDNLAFEIDGDPEFVNARKKSNGFTIATIEDINKIDIISDDNLPSKSIISDKNGKNDVGNGLESLQIKSLVIHNEQLLLKPIEIYKRIDENCV